MALLQDFSLPVHKSLQQPDLVFGIPKIVLAVILCLTMILVYLFGLFLVVSGIIMYFPCYLVSKQDPDMLTIAIDNLFQIDYLEG